MHEVGHVLCGLFAVEDVSNYRDTVLLQHGAELFAKVRIGERHREGSLEALHVKSFDQVYQTAKAELLKVLFFLLA